MTSTKRPLNELLVAETRPNLLVFGVGHSGTTVVTRMLFALGWSPGGPEGTADEGFAEHVDVRECNRHALRHSVLPEQARGIVRDLSTPWAVKDPRFVITLPLWQAAFESLDAPLPTLLWIVRDLDEVKQSYLRRHELVDGMPGSHARTVEQLWDSAVEGYASWRGPKLQLAYEQLVAAASLFSPVVHDSIAHRPTQPR